MDGECLQLTPFSEAKALCYLDRLLGQSPGPATATVDLTNVCNHDCIWCNSRDYHDSEPGYIQPDVFKRLVRSLVDMQCRGMSVSGGGEPTCHPQFDSLISLALDSGLSVSLSTNGSLIGRLPIETLYRLRYLRISLDAGSSETHARLHRPRAEEYGWTQIWRNLIALARNKPRTLCLGVGYLIHSENLSETADLARQVREAGADYLELRPVKQRSVHCDAQQVRDVYEHVRELETPGFRVIEVGSKYRPGFPGTEKCYMLSLVVDVGPGGYVYPCCELKGRPNYVIGNLGEAPLERIWWGAQHQVIMKSVSPAKCPDCKHSRSNHLIRMVLEDDVLHRDFL